MLSSKLGLYTKPNMSFLRLTLNILFCIFLISCGDNRPLTPQIRASISDVIVGNLDWSNFDKITDPLILKNAKKVGYITTASKRNSRCTAFLISPDHVISNWHCFSSKDLAVNSQFYPEFYSGENPKDYLSTPHFTCDELVLSERLLDFAILKCKGSPGNTYGYFDLRAPETTPSKNVYAIHQNCDFFRGDRQCAPTKKYSPGQLMNLPLEDVDDVSQSLDLFYTSDTLGGSSGGAVFSADTHQLLALHHRGHGGDAFGRGSSNSGVPISAIVKYLSIFETELYQQLVASPLDFFDLDLKFLGITSSIERAVPLLSDLTFTSHLEKKDSFTFFKIHLDQSFQLMINIASQSSELKMNLMDSDLNEIVDTSELSMEQELSEGDYYLSVANLGEEKALFQIQMKKRPL